MPTYSKRILRALATTLGCMLTMSACLEDLPEPTKIDDLRVLAVRAEPAEAAPGAVVQLDALVVDPEQRPQTLSWSACILPERGRGFFSGGGGETGSSGGQGAGLDDPGTCADAVERGDAFAVDLGTGATAELTIPDGLTSDPLALAAAYGLPTDVVVPAEIVDLFVGIAGINYTISLVVEIEGQTRVTNKRLNISPATKLPGDSVNENPVDMAFSIVEADAGIEPPGNIDVPPVGSCRPNGDPIALSAETNYIIAPQNIPDPQATYLVLLAGSTDPAQPFEVQTDDEVYYYSFFSTAGSIGKDISKSSALPNADWSIGEDPDATGDFWVVVRDGRGGVGWCHSDIVISQ